MAPTGERPEKDPRSLPKLADLEYSSYNSEDALVQDIIEGMKVAGACIIRKIISKETMAKIGEEMDPYLRLPDCTPGQFFPKETRKTSSMMSKSETYALNIVGNSVWQKVGEYFLTSTLKDYWVNQSPPYICGLHHHELTRTCLSGWQRNSYQRQQASAQLYARLRHWAWSPRSRSSPR